MAPAPDVPRETVSTQVLIRFVLRIIILSVFAAVGRQGFAKTLESLLILALCYCLVIGALRREAPLGPILNHYDEAAAYAVISAGLAARLA